MSGITLLGSVAAILGIITFLPQVIQTVTTKKTKHLSLPTWIIIFVNSLLWSLYGYFRQDAPVVFVNVVVFINAAIILFYKLKFG